MGIGDWGLGIGDWDWGLGPNPQSPIPNPQSPIPNFFLKFIIILNNNYILLIYKMFLIFDLFFFINLAIKNLVSRDFSLTNLNL